MTSECNRGVKPRLKKRKIFLAALYAWGIPMIMAIAVKVISILHENGDLPIGLVPLNPGQGPFTGMYFKC